VSIKNNEGINKYCFPQFGFGNDFTCAIESLLSWIYLRFDKLWWLHNHLAIFGHRILTVCVCWSDVPHPCYQSGYIYFFFLQWGICIFGFTLCTNKNANHECPKIYCSYKFSFPSCMLFYMKWVSSSRKGILSRL